MLPWFVVDHRMCWWDRRLRPWWAICHEANLELVSLVAEGLEQDLGCWPAAPRVDWAWRMCNRGRVDLFCDSCKRKYIVSD